MSISDAVVERMRTAIDAVQLFSRDNDGVIEICRYGQDGESEIVVLERSHDREDERNTLARRVSIERAKAALDEAGAGQMAAEIERLTKVLTRVRHIVHHNLHRQNEKLDDVVPLIDVTLPSRSRVMIELKPCPFCGAELVETPSPFQTDMPHFKHPGASLNEDHQGAPCFLAGRAFHALPEVVTLWNTRALPTPPEAEND